MIRWIVDSAARRMGVGVQVVETPRVATPPYVKVIDK